jgi:hypothetical protein
MTHERLSNSSQHMECHGHFLDGATRVFFVQHDDTSHKNAGILFFYSSIQVMGSFRIALSTERDVRVPNDSLLVLTRWILHLECWHSIVLHIPVSIDYPFCCWYVMHMAMLLPDTGCTWYHHHRWVSPEQPSQVKFLSTRQYSVHTSTKFTSKSPLDHLDGIPCKPPKVYGYVSTEKQPPLKN